LLARPKESPVAAGSPAGSGAGGKKKQGGGRPERPKKKKKTPHPVNHPRINQMASWAFATFGIMHGFFFQMSIFYIFSSFFTVA